jgi:periplasmic mercuric ion binding protein
MFLSSSQVRKWVLDFFHSIPHPFAMKYIIPFIAVLSVLSFSTARADTELVINGVHNCCETCTKRIEKIVDGTGNKFVKAGNGGIVVMAKGKSDGKKIVDALMDEGFYGTTDAAPTASASTPATKSATPSKPAKMVKTAKVTGAHLCCQRCASTLIGAIRAIPGVKTHSIYPQKKEFEIVGEFDREAVLPAMNIVGFHGKVK